MISKRHMRIYAVFIGLAVSALIIGQTSPDIASGYSKAEYQIPMRDGVKLFTAVYVPKDTDQRYPFMMMRTPYSVAPYGVDQYKDNLGPSPLFGSEGRGMVRVTDPELAWRTFRAIERTQAVLYLQKFVAHAGEVQAALNGVPGVLDAAVLPRRDRHGDVELVAYVVPADPSHELEELRASLASELPGHLVPGLAQEIGIAPVGPSTWPTKPLENRFVFKGPPPVTGGTQ